MTSTLADHDRLIMFRHSFHRLSDRAYWPEMRKAMCPDSLASIEGRLADDGQVQVRKPTVAEHWVELGSVHSRKFVSGGDPVCIEAVLTSLRNCGVAGQALDEATGLWLQLSDRRLTFMVIDGHTVGMKIPQLGQPVWWKLSERERLPLVEERSISLKEATEVVWNEGFFHGFRPGRNEEVRSMIRSIPQVWRDQLAFAAIGAGLYCAIIAHHLLGQIDDARLTCDPSCQEHRMIQVGPDAARLHHVSGTDLRGLASRLRLTF